MANKKKEQGQPEYSDPTRKEYLKKFFGDAVWDEDRFALRVIPSSSFALNYILGVDGIPLGRIIQLAGAESSGKTTLCMDIMKHAEDMGYGFLFFDAEQTFSADLAKDMGIKTPPEEYLVRESRAATIWAKLIGPHKDLKKQEGILLPDSDIGDYFLREKNLKLIVIDSINALIVPKVEKSDFETQQVGAVSLFLSQNLPLLLPRLSYTGVSLIGIQQLRSKIGVMYGPSETTSGGRAWKHDVSVAIHLEASSAKDDKIFDKQGAVVGTVVRARIAKSKVSRPFLYENYRVMFGKGIVEVEREIANIAIKNEVVKKPNNVTYEYGGTTWRGLEKFVEAVGADESLRQKLVEDIYNTRNIFLEVSTLPPEEQVNLSADDSDIV